MTNLTYVLLLFILLLFSCHNKEDLDRITQLTAKVEQLQKEGEKQVKECASKINGQRAEVCAEIMDRAQVRLKAHDLTVDKSWIETCKVPLAVTKIDLKNKRVYLTYQVPAQDNPNAKMRRRLTSAMDLSGKYPAQSVLYIKEGVEYPVLIEVKSCLADMCEIRCMEIRTQPIQCAAPVVSPLPAS